jgi:hypothetical protein
MSASEQATACVKILNKTGGFAKEAARSMLTGIASYATRQHPLYG